jgi:hypothetical protein
VTAPGLPAQPGEQIAFQDILESYQKQVSHLTHELVLANCRIANRDKELADLRRDRELPDTPHR